MPQNEYQCLNHVCIVKATSISSVLVKGCANLLSFHTALYSFFALGSPLRFIPQPCFPYVQAQFSFHSITPHRIGLHRCGRVIGDKAFGLSCGQTQFPHDGVNRPFGILKVSHFGIHLYYIHYLGLHFLKGFSVWGSSTQSVQPLFC